MTERNKGGRPLKDGVKRKGRNVYCSDDEFELFRKIRGLSAEQKDFLRRWIEKGGNVNVKRKD